jgi:hypothetical protein
MMSIPNKILLMGLDVLLGVGVEGGLVLGVSIMRCFMM